MRRQSYEYHGEMEVERDGVDVIVTFVVLVTPGEPSSRDKYGLRVDPDEPTETEFLSSSTPLCPEERALAEEIALEDFAQPAGI